MNPLLKSRLKTHGIQFNGISSYSRKTIQNKSALITGAVFALGTIPLTPSMTTGSHLFYCRSISIKETRERELNLKSELEARRINGIKRIVYERNDILGWLGGLEWEKVGGLSMRDLEKLYYNSFVLDLPFISSRQINQSLLFPSNATVREAVRLNSLSLEKYSILIRNYLLALTDSNGRAQVDQLTTFLVTNEIPINTPLLLEFLKYHSSRPPNSSTSLAIKSLLALSPGWQQSPPLYAALISVYGYIGQVWKCMDLLKIAEDVGFKVPMAQMIRIARLFSRTPNFGGGKSKDNPIAGLLAARRDESDVRWWEGYMEVLRITRQHKKAILVFGDLLASKVIPTLKIYTIALEIFCKVRNTTAASEIFLKCREQKIQPDASFFNIMIRYLLQVERNTTLAEKYHSMMLEMGIKENIETFTLLVSLYGIHLRDITKALEVKNRMIDVPMDRAFCEVMIEVCSLARAWSEAKEWYESVPVPSKEMIRIIMGVEMGKQVELAVEKLKKEQKLAPGDLKKELFQFNMKEVIQYFTFAENRSMVNESLIRQYCLLLLVSGSPIAKVIDVYMEKVKHYQIQANERMLFMVCDFIVRPNMAIQEHVLGDGRHTYFVAREDKEECSKEFGRLMDLLKVDTVKMSSASVDYLQQCKKYIK